MPRHRKLLSALCATVCLAGCAATGTPRSVDSLPKVEYEAVRRMSENVLAESKKLSAAHDTLQKELSAPRQPVALPLVAPALDPLEAKTINVSMMGASVGQLLAAVADQAGLNLVVEPAVLALDKRADMYLKKVSLREAFNEVMRAFDLAGEIKGNTLRVNLMDERVFALDLLNTAMSLDVSSGGNVFGANNSSNGSSNALRGNVTLSGNNGSKVDPYEQIELGVRRILGEADDAKKPAPAMDDTARDKRAAYSLNRTSGSLYVMARPSQIRSIEKMLDRTQKILRRQVQIEAQLIDVQLNDGFELGVDWNLLRHHAAAGFGVNPARLNAVEAALPQPGAALPPRTLSIPAQLVGSQSGPSFGAAYQSGAFGIVLSALRSFGNVKVLSNPSVQVRNGIPALLSVGTTSRYVSKSTVTQTNPGGGASTTSADVQTDAVFSGVMIGVVPFVRDDGRIELMVHPMQTDVDAKSLQLIDVGNGNRVTLPVVNFKGMTTTLNVSDGDTVLIGGLIDQRTSDDDRGAPAASDIPLFGTLFGNKRNTHASRELIMVLRVKVL
ncbi:pilus (MSHA type) biogenesis protein MshL [Ralstonia sp. RL]|uniref:pilus (MSHA type) biogenesis protein MshL n=1 Tax=Ralstonia sp. RL TaxID=1839756 RepID=UPI00257A1ACC|nr:pilus (MSHA type) biogenesis protein MshL [Ralstonia sp. RL]